MKPGVRVSFFQQILPTDAGYAGNPAKELKKYIYRTLLPEAQLCQEENPPSTWLSGMLLSNATTMSSLWRRELQSCVGKVCGGIPLEASLGPRFLGA